MNQSIRDILERISDGFVALDREWRYTYVNARASELLRRSPQSLLGRSQWAEFPELAGGAFAEACRRALREQVPARAEDQFGSEERRLESRIYPSSEGLEIYLTVVAERGRAEQALRASERRYRNVFEQSRDTIYITRPDGSIEDVNPAAEELFGLSRAEMLRRHAVDLYADPDDHDRLLAVVREEGSVRDHEVRLRRASGEEFDALVSAAVMREAGEVVALQGTIRDVTERKEVERKLVAQEAWFRSLTQNALDIITVLDAEGRIRYATPSGARTLGYPYLNLRGTPLVELVHPEDRPLVTAALNHLVHDGAEPITLSARMRASDGSWQVHQAVAQSLLHDPAVRGVVVNSRDVTGQRLLESQLRQALKMEAVGRLAGGVAHDLNNVLMAITGFAALLEGEVQPTEDATLFLTEIHKATERAASLTRQLLAFGRKQSLHPEVVNLNSVVKGAKGMLRRLIREDVELVYRLSDRLETCRVDPHQVEQVLVSLVVNATDALPRGGSVEVATRNRTVGDSERRTHPYLPPGGYVCLTVRDTGDGMDAETLARIFDPFFTTREQGKGTGLGLSTVYGIVKQSGGYVWGESEPGAGSTFTVLFPGTPGEEAREETVPAAGRPLRPGQGTVLLAEDEEGVRLLARLTLRKAGYTVLEARDGEDALRVAGEHAGPIDLLLTDVVMPRLGGYALAERLRATRPSLRVLYMSGYAGDSLRDVPLDEREFLAKPISPDALTDRVRKALQ